MDTTESSSAFMVLTGHLILDELAVRPPKKWTPIHCASKQAHGCGKLGQEVLEGLSIWLSLFDTKNLTASLSIRMSNDAIRSVEADLDIPRGMADAEGSVRIANQELLVLTLFFRRQCCVARAYYLVYDSTDTSLTMIPCLPRDLEATWSLTPVPQRAADGDRMLAVMAQKFWPQPVDRDVLCVRTLPTMANPGSDSNALWQRKTRRFPKLPQPFKADLMFSLDGKVFWADLSQGLAYCDLCAGGCGSVVDITFVPLPDGYQVLFAKLPDDTPTEPTNKSRTMGCTGGSIKFIFIDRSSASRGSEMVFVWTLKDLGRQQWEGERGFSMEGALGSGWLHGRRVAGR
ncbi:unnamed protein product [Urochloa decumbens]|uniref:DUF1618 domain-containing protein n=1 Tax=Urochloa decumbens TaxID=240449 RepID=A0ABC8XQP3_9POAL